MKALLQTQPRKKPRQPKRRNKKKSTDVIAALCFAVALSLFLSSTGVTLARYIHEDHSATMAVASPFYFTSDYLTADGKTHSINEPDGDTVTLTFSLHNFVDELRCSSADISYSYWAESGGAKVTAEKTGSLTGGARNTGSCSLDVAKSSIQNGTVTVKAQATRPYVKTLHADFSYAARSYSLRWETETTGSAVVLRVTGAKGPVTVSWEKDLLPDPTGTVAVISGKTAAFTAMAGEEYALIFLLPDAGMSVTRNDFTVSEG